MKIGFFVPRCEPDNSHGRYVIALAEAMAAAHDVTVCAGAITPSLRPGIRRQRTVVPNRPSIVRLVVGWAAAALAMRGGRFDVVHVQGADAPIGHVVTAHCCNAAMRAAVAGDGQGLSRRLNYALGLAVERYSFTRPSRRVIAVSRKVEREIVAHYGVAAGRVEVIPHGVDAEQFEPGRRRALREASRKRLGLGPGEMAVLFVGADYRLKGLLPLVQASRRLRPAPRILAVGVAPDRRLTAWLAREGAGATVTLVGPTRDMAGMYAAADVFALPTAYDTFSLVTLEAMACGLPVLVSNHAGASELLAHEHDALVLDDPRDVDELAAHLERLVGDAGLRERLGRAARATAEHHSWARVAERTLDVYRGVALPAAR